MNTTAMEEIRIPYHKIPADIWKRLQDISNEVRNPCAPLGSANGNSPILFNTSSLSSLLPSPSTISTLSESVFTTAITTQPFSATTSSSSSSSSTSTTNRSTGIPDLSGVSRNRTFPPSVIVSHHGNGDDTDCEGDEVDGGDVDSIVHVVNDDELRHQRSPRASMLEVMDDSDIVRIFPDADVRKPTLSNSPRKPTDNSFHSDDSGIVRIFPENDNEDDDTDDVDHGSSHRSRDVDTECEPSTYRITPKKIHSRHISVTESKPSSDNSPLTFNPLPANEFLTSQNPKTKDRVHRSPRGTSKFSPYKNSKQHIRVQSQDTTNTFQHKQGMFERQSSPSEKKQRFDFNPQPHPLTNIIQSNKYKPNYYENNESNIIALNNNRNVNKQTGDCGEKTSTTAIPSSTPTKFMKIIETTPTKTPRKSPSNVGSVRRSPGLPTPPQTPDEAEIEDDDEVFSYDVSNPFCNVGESVQLSHESPLPGNSVHQRLHSDTRTNECGKIISRQSSRPSPLSFNSTHKMARVRVGDRQHSRKRLLFEEVEPMKNESMTELNQYWAEHNFIQNQRASFTHPTPRRKSSSPLNSPPRSHYLTNSNLLPETMHDIDSQMTRPIPSVQVCCPSSTHCQSSPRPSHYAPSSPAHCQSNAYINKSRLDVTMDDEVNPKSHQVIYSSMHDVTSRPANQIQCASEGVPRHRFHSEGYTDDDVENPVDRTRSKNSNNDLVFQGRPRGQTFSTHSKRRHFDLDQDEIESPPSPHHPPLNLRLPQPLQPSPQTRYNFSAPHQQQPKSSSQTTIPTPQADCSCASFKRTFLSMASDAYNRLSYPFAAREDYSRFRQELAETNRMVRDLMEMFINFNAVCEHNKNPSMHQAAVDLEPGTSGMSATTAATVPIPEMTMSSEESSSSQIPSLFSSFNV